MNSLVKLVSHPASHLVKVSEKLLKFFEPNSLRSRTVVVGGLTVAILEYLTHSLVAHSRASLALNALIDASVIAIFMIVLLGVVVAAARVQRNTIANEMRTVGELNHHVRNALQIIRESHRLPTDKQTEAVIESVDRIDGTLRTLFPAMTTRRVLEVHEAEAGRSRDALSTLLSRTAKVTRAVFPVGHAQAVTSGNSMTEPRKP
jgi:two-component sensor histidine kinase